MTETTWITDRRPTESDADSDGDVKLHDPVIDSVFVHWKYVAEGAPWAHAPDWTPPASQPGFEVGQRWKRRDGEIVTVTQVSGAGCWVRDDAGRPWGHLEDGTAPSCPDSFDLVELLPTTVSPEPIITETKSELICTFEYGGKTYQAVATPAAPTLREQALSLVADCGAGSHLFTAAQMATIRAALEAQS